jgi:hypothetical protein
MRKCFFFLTCITLVVLTELLFGLDHTQQFVREAYAENEAAAVYPSMPGPGKKVQIGNGRYAIYGFDKQPKLGTVIIKVQVYTAEGKKDTSLVIKADSGMPSMKGAHETGEREFSISKNGDYLLPITIVMPGEWEIRLTILQDGKVIFRGRYNFDV